MSRRARLLLVALAAGIVVIGAYSWWRLEAARTQQQFDAALEAARQAAAAGKAGVSLCERALPVLERALPGVEERERGSDRVKRAHRAMAGCLMLVGRYQQAAEAFEKLVYYEPQQARWHGDLALAMLRAGKRHGALQHAHLAVQLAPNTWQAHRVLARVLAADGRTQEALAAMQKAKSLAPAEEQQAAQRAIDRLAAKAGGTAPPETDDDD